MCPGGQPASGRASDSNRSTRRMPAYRTGPSCHWSSREYSTIIKKCMSPVVTLLVGRGLGPNAVVELATLAGQLQSLVSVVRVLNVVAPHEGLRGGNQVVNCCSCCAPDSCGQEPTREIDFHHDNGRHCVEGRKDMPPRRSGKAARRTKATKGNQVVSRYAPDSCGKSR